ncbi:DUF5605 domain-containing protein [Plantibacter flavus]|uniref:DUF5605 domain-containing protein n=1 Tax=Plantibacter flavus TaxID=150123 RepID=UPI003F149938
MRTISPRTKADAALFEPSAEQAIREIAPQVYDSPMVRTLGDFPLQALLNLILNGDEPLVARIMGAIAEFPDLSPQAPVEPVIVPSADYESASVPVGSARIRSVRGGGARRRSEIVIDGPSHGNPFVDVDLTATFQLDDIAVHAGGFYDGDGTYRIRFLPPTAGTWRFRTSSNARSLDGLTGEILVDETNDRGPVRAGATHFAYADGSPFTPIGTTAYVWTHQPQELQDQTVQSLAGAPFNKLRMGLFPKSFLYNENEPDRFVFERGESGDWDLTRFDIAYFANLERRLDELEALGIEADLILFHPYDRWGFAAMGATADDRYVTYVTRRLSAFRNVWWSMANEYDLLLTKDTADWNRLAGLVRSNDPVGHPLSIHNWVELFDYSVDWATHSSIQRGDHAIGGMISQWQRQWGKPVVVDEFGYEGDIDQGWGNLTAEEVVRRFWDGVLHGGALTHGETFRSADDVLWWSKGGPLRGESPERLRFLREIIEASPSGRIEPVASDWDFPSGGVAGRYIVTYYGASRPGFRDVTIPDGMTARIEVIDTWNMTVDAVPGIHTGVTRVELPARPYIALRLTAVDETD